MNTIKKKHSQFELFPGSTEHIISSEEKHSSLVNFTLSLDKILIISVAVIMIMVLSFSLGVERGKGSAQSLTKTKRVNQGQVSEATQEVLNVNDSSQPAEAFTQPVRKESEEFLPAALTAKALPERINGFYTIQVASFKKEKYARQEADALEKKGYESIVLPKGSHSIVCVGKFIRRMEAKVFSKKLRKKYKDCLVRRL